MHEKSFIFVDLKDRSKRVSDHGIWKNGIVYENQDCVKYSNLEIFQIICPKNLQLYMELPAWNILSSYFVMRLGGVHKLRLQDGVGRWLCETDNL